MILRADSEVMLTKWGSLFLPQERNAMQIKKNKNYGSH
jgi:hypothetical protein